jgi:hypothetical protein
MSSQMAKKNPRKYVTNGKEIFLACRFFDVAKLRAKWQYRVSRVLIDKVALESYNLSNIVVDLESEDDGKFQLLF